LRPHCAEQLWLSHGVVQQDMFPQSRGLEQPKMQRTSLVKPLRLTNGFDAPKYLLIAIVEFLQKKHARRSIPSPEKKWPRESEQVR